MDLHPASPEGVGKTMSPVRRPLSERHSDSRSPSLDLAGGKGIYPGSQSNASQHSTPTKAEAVLLATKDRVADALKLGLRKFKDPLGL